jgi:hypothetical protein
MYYLSDLCVSNSNLKKMIKHWIFYVYKREKKTFFWLKQKTVKTYLCFKETTLWKNGGKCKIEMEVSRRKSNEGFVPKDKRRK